MYDKEKLRGSMKFSLPLQASLTSLLLILCSLLSITIMFCIPKQAGAHVTIPIHTSTINLASTAHFLKYENSTYGIKMVYPSNWQKIETKSHDKENRDNNKDIAEFTLSSSTNNPSIDQATLRILTHKLPSQNVIVNLFTLFDKTASQKISLEGFVLSHVTTLLTTLPDFHLIASDSREITLPDNTPAHKLVYEYREQGQKNVLNKGMEILIVKGATGYIIRYIAEEPKYLDYLPIVQQMVNSVEIAK
jgi:hypothetical protein